MSVCMPTWDMYVHVYLYIHVCVYIHVLLFFHTQTRKPHTPWQGMERFLEEMEETLFALGHP